MLDWLMSDSLTKTMRRYAPFFMGLKSREVRLVCARACGRLHRLSRQRQVYQALADLPDHTQRRLLRRGFVHLLPQSLKRIMLPEGSLADHTLRTVPTMPTVGTPARVAMRAAAPATPAPAVSFALSAAAAGRSKPLLPRLAQSGSEPSTPSTDFDRRLLQLRTPRPLSPTAARLDRNAAHYFDRVRSAFLMDHQVMALGGARASEVSAAIQRARMSMHTPRPPVSPYRPDMALASLVGRTRQPGAWASSPPSASDASASDGPETLNNFMQQLVRQRVITWVPRAIVLAIRARLAAHVPPPLPQRAAPHRPHASHRQRRACSACGCGPACRPGRPVEQRASHGADTAAR